VSSRDRVPGPVAFPIEVSVSSEPPGRAPPEILRCFASDRDKRGRVDAYCRVEATPWPVPATGLATPFIVHLLHLLLMAARQTPMDSVFWAAWTGTPSQHIQGTPALGTAYTGPVRKGFGKGLMASCQSASQAFGESDL